MSVKICEECGKEFQVRHWRDKWCGPECKDIATKRRHRVNNAKYRAAKEKVKAPSMQPKQCPVCHETYEPAGAGQKSCDKFACRRAIGACASKDSIEPCVICGADYLVKKHSYKQTCSGECERAFNSVTQAKVAETVNEKNAAIPPWLHDMKCPWFARLFDTIPAPGYGWHTAEADPMTMRCVADGVWFEVRETETKRRKAA